jgi:hypothetical protein
VEPGLLEHHNPQGRLSETNPARRQPLLVASNVSAARAIASAHSDAQRGACEAYIKSQAQPSTSPRCSGIANPPFYRSDYAMPGGLGR